MIIHFILPHQIIYMKLNIRWPASLMATLKSASRYRHSSFQPHLRPMQLAFLAALAISFADNAPELVEYFSIVIFQCPGLNGCTIRAKVADKDFALFWDQVNDLVRADYPYLRGSLRRPVILQGRARDA
jgi:hypothetical protein